MALVKVPAVMIGLAYKHPRSEKSPFLALLTEGIFLPKIGVKYFSQIRHIKGKSQ